MNILFLDDNPVRCEMFQSEVPSAIIVETAQECIEKLSLEGNRWDYVLLDHDLGGEIHVDSAKKNTGMEVVRWLSKNFPIINHIIIHSHNVPAAKLMENALQKMGYKCWRKPFQYKMGQEIK
jgi:CheY-like chemotaxis protein